MKHRTIGMTGRFVVTVMTLIALSGSAGCFLPIPLAVFPAPEEGSGLELRFYDHDDNRIEEDGLLIVNREFDFFGGRLAPSNHVVRIRSGRARIPHEWTPASFWMFPFMIPLPHMPVVIPGQSMTILPLLPGYRTRDVAGAVRDRGCVTLSKTDSTTDIWRREVLSFVRRRFEKRAHDHGSDIRLNPYQYDLVTQFIATETRLEAQQRRRAR